MINLHNLSIGYAGEPLLENINETFELGNFYCILGRNGSGKSTLIRTISGIHKPINGYVTLEDKPLNSYSNKIKAQRIALVLSRSPQTNYLKVIDLLNLARYPNLNHWAHHSKKDYDHIHKFIDIFNIQELISKRLNECSDGQLQKVMIARAFIQASDVILLDEPTAFLDPAQKLEIMQLLPTIAKEQHKLVVASTHDVALAAHTANQFGVIDHQTFKMINPKTSNLTNQLPSWITAHLNESTSGNIFR